MRSARRKAKAAETTVDLRADMPVDVPVEAPVEALVVMGDDRPPADAWVGRNEPAQSVAPQPPAAAAPARSPSGQAEILRLLEVVTNMCDHVIEYVEADKAERRLMLDTLTQLAQVVTEGATTIAAISAQALAPPAPPITIEVAEAASEVAPETIPLAAAPDASIAVSTEPVVDPPDEFFAFAPGERVLGGSMPAGPEPIIDLVEAEPEPDPEPSPAAQPEFAAVAPASPQSTMEIAVEVRGRFGDRWVDGFEICEVMTTPDGPRYRLRRQRDGVVLPELFDATNIRHVETFEQLGEAYSAHPAGKGRINGNGSSRNGSNGNGSNGASYWSRS